MVYLIFSTFFTAHIFGTYGITNEPVIFHIYVILFSINSHIFSQLLDKSSHICKSKCVLVFFPLPFCCSGITDFTIECDEL